MNLRQSNISFHDFQPEPENFLEEVLRGLARTPKRISPKFFYDEAGSHLFEEILEQPEYYIPDVERRLLHTHAEEFASLIGPDAVVIEPGSGSCEKVQLLLDNVIPAAYVPMDISGDFLQKAAQDLGTEFPWLPIYAACTDFSRDLSLPHNLPDGRKIIFIPGSSLGNFEPQDMLRFLSRVRSLVGDDGAALIGVDRKKDHTILNAAYNDDAGVTEAFNLNLLHRINRELGADFEPDAFSHLAFYNPEHGRIEMHLVSQADQQVKIAEQTFHFQKDETIHTENSYKYDTDEFIALTKKAGFPRHEVWTDPDHLFSLFYLEVR